MIKLLNLPFPPWFVAWEVEKSESWERCEEIVAKDVAKMMIEVLDGEMRLGTEVWLGLM